MSDNIVRFPDDDKLPPLLIGPFQTYRVVVDGRVIPKLTGHPEGSDICLVVDGRFGAIFTKEKARDAAWLIAQALAVGSGYPHLAAENKDEPFAPVSCEITPEDEQA